MRPRSSFQFGSRNLEAFFPVASVFVGVNCSSPFADLASRLLLSSRSSFSSERPASRSRRKSCCWRASVVPSMRPPSSASANWRASFANCAARSPPAPSPISSNCCATPRCWRASARAVACISADIWPPGIGISPCACALIEPCFFAISCNCCSISENPDADDALFTRSRSRASDAAARLSDSAASPNEFAACDAPRCSDICCVACATFCCASDIARCDRPESSDDF